MLPVIVGFTALVIDVGMLYCAKADLQRAADAAALAGASSYFSDSGLSQDQSEIVQLVTERAQETSLRNPTLGEATTLELPDIAVGRHDWDNPTGPLLSTTPFNAVQVTVRRTTGSVNGPVPLLFARIWDRYYGDVTASARAAMNDQFSGYQFEEDAPFLPFTIHQDLYEDMAENGDDDFAYDGEILRQGDGVQEIRLFPWKWSDEDEALEDLGSPDDGDGNDASGNFGTLNIGIGNQGTIELASQIIDGISAAELEAEFGTSELVFHDDVNGSQTYTATGNPGLSTALRFPLLERLGDVVAFFVHQDSSDNGSNANFEISGVRYGRIVAVELTGKPDRRALVIQPVAATDGNVVVDDEAPPTDGQIGRVMLVQ